MRNRGIDTLCNMNLTNVGQTIRQWSRINRLMPWLDSVDKNDSIILPSCWLGGVVNSEPTDLDHKNAPSAWVTSQRKPINLELHHRVLKPKSYHSPFQFSDIYVSWIPQTPLPLRYSRDRVMLCHRWQPPGYDRGAFRGLNLRSRTVLSSRTCFIPYTLTSATPVFLNVFTSPNF